MHLIFIDCWYIIRIWRRRPVRWQRTPRWRGDLFRNHLVVLQRLLVVVLLINRRDKKTSWFPQRENMHICILIYRITHSLKPLTNKVKVQMQIEKGREWVESLTMALRYSLSRNNESPRSACRIHKYIKQKKKYTNFSKLLKIGNFSTYH